MSFPRVVDLESQALPVVPVAAYTDTPRGSSTELQHKLTRSHSGLTDEFFGLTRGSRHDCRLSADITDTLPAYVAEDTELPQYSVVAPEPVTLAMYLFKFGFFFPPFWILGALILLSPLREPIPTSPSPSSHPSPASTTSSPSTASMRWMPEKTESERLAIILEMRRVEVKWAKRCLIALSILVCIAAGAGVIIWWVLRNSAMP